MMQTLEDLCTFADGRVAVADLNLDRYISTENMLPNKEGIARSAGLPTVNQTQAYQAEDVLVSNIRPYFKKIWYADCNGGCSNDVLVLRAKDGCNPGFLYYLLSDDKFFDYATATAKGTKMPRGDKGAIMRYKVPKLPLDIQIGIADTLSALDARIAENRAINNHLCAPNHTSRCERPIGSKRRLRNAQTAGVAGCNGVYRPVRTSTTPATDSSPDIRRGNKLSRVA
jgi:type I restriction enzyme S subunit